MMTAALLLAVGAPPLAAQVGLAPGLAARFRDLAGP